MCEESSMKKKFPAMAEVGMKGRPAGPGRDEFSSSHPSSDPSSHSSSCTPRLKEGFRDSAKSFLKSGGF